MPLQFLDRIQKSHIPLMLLSNTDVPNGHANGTRVILQSIVLNDGAQCSQSKIDNRPCKIVQAHDVNYLLCTKEDDPTKVFKIEPKQLTCQVSAPVPKIYGASSKSSIKFSVTLQQLPLVANNATTGHKLQGQTKKNLVISVWSNRSNWNYVALSRVATREGLYLTQPLPFDTDFSIHADLRTMIEDFQQFTPEDVHFDVELEERIWMDKARGSMALPH